MQKAAPDLDGKEGTAKRQNASLEEEGDGARAPNQDVGNVAKRLKASPDEDEGDAAQPDRCCTNCEAELGPDDNGGEGHTCHTCWGRCEVNQVCSDCIYDRGFICATCGECHNHDCSDGSESEQFICDECLEIYCKECGDPKPGKDGTKRCISCQPWWQKNKPAEAFCKYCGSQRQDANFCTKCGERVCYLCFSSTCERCEDPDFFQCEDCGVDPEVTLCEICGQSLCYDCKCSCTKDGEEDENAEE